MKPKYLALLLGLAISSSALAEVVLPTELVMPTDVGKVAIEAKDCPVENSHGFIYSAYATESNKVAKTGSAVPTVHNGCWKKEGDIVYIWFYDEAPPIVASYKDYHFKQGELK